MASGASARDVSGTGRSYAGNRWLRRQGSPAHGRREDADPASGATAERGNGKEAARRRALGSQRRLARSFGTAGVEAHREHRGFGGRLYRSGREDGPSASSGGEDRHAPGTGHDSRGYAGLVEGSSGE